MPKIVLNDNEIGKIYLNGKKYGGININTNLDFPYFSQTVPIKREGNATVVDYSTPSYGYGYPTADSNNAILKNPFVDSTTLKLSIRFYRTNDKTSMGIIGNGYSNYYGSLPSFEINNNNISMGYAFSVKNGWDRWVTLNPTITNTWYTEQLEWDGAKIYCRSLDASGTLIEEQIYESTIAPTPNDPNCYYSLFGFGYDVYGHVGTYLKCDLNNCYYAKNGEIIWGNNQMEV